MLPSGLAMCLCLRLLFHFKIVCRHVVRSFVRSSYFILLIIHSFIHCFKNNTARRHLGLDFLHSEMSASQQSNHRWKHPHLHLKEPERHAATQPHGSTIRNETKRNEYEYKTRKCPFCICIYICIISFSRYGCGWGVHQRLFACLSSILLAWCVIARYLAGVLASYSIVSYRIVSYLI
mmetsp:Transcript_5504/g.13598  ORF Transcript_5504/g.13598 Transcript_5504/m.13598 type:complete len:178 (+) Transcript_5504:436-969(+)